jgi:CBS domain-containing protein
MRREVISVPSTESVFEADHLMRLARLRHLPVVDRDILVGLLTHRDLLVESVTRLEEDGTDAGVRFRRSQPVARVMRRELETVEGDVPLRDAARRMLRLRLGCLPVVEWTAQGPRLIGLVTEGDLLRAASLLAAQREED